MGAAQSGSPQPRTPGTPAAPASASDYAALQGYLQDDDKMLELAAVVQDEAPAPLYEPTPHDPGLQPHQGKSTEPISKPKALQIQPITSKL